MLAGYASGATPPLAPTSDKDTPKGAPREGISKASLLSERSDKAAKTEIASASIVCQTCEQVCALSSRLCDVCEAAPQLHVGDYSFKGAKRMIYDATKGPALSNSVVFLGRALGRAAVPTEPDRVDEPTEMQIAMKTVPLDSEASSVEMARREIQVFQSLGSKHPNLLPLLFGAETDQEIVLLTPYAPGGDLHSRTCVAGSTFNCLEEQDAGNLTQQLLTGLVALHDQRYVHGDIKPHNVFLTEADGSLVAQLGDFGLTRRIPDGTDGVPSEGGTPGYMAPEAVGHMIGEARPLVTFAIDLFALGIMIYELLSSMSPFDPPSNCRAPLEFDEACWEPLTPEAVVFVTVLMEKSAEARGTAAEALRHPWLAAAAARSRDGTREVYAPEPDRSIRFHSMDRVWELYGSNAIS
mmetsp:Transcript_12691/g.23739  ORF Transcript_12691/g.23739 Transcript_12691/m.23739 type:complete len:410 (+) Transcript_12691:80-1309(+)